MLNPTGYLSLKDTLHIKDEVNINNPCIPHMKGIRNYKGADLCLPFLLGGNCDSTDPYGYHLQVNDPERLPGMSNTDYKTLHDCAEASKEHVCISTAASHNNKMAPSSSS